MAYRCVLAVVLVAAVFAVKACNFPPDLWCSSPEVSKICNVEKQCAKKQTPINNAPKVNFTLYLESYCPDCQQFITGQLHKAYPALEDIMHLTLVPYGNARETKQGSKWVFQCQHGDIECQGNIIETCTLHYGPFDKAYNAIYCMEVTHDPVNNAHECISKCGLDYTQIAACANSSLGNALEHQMALKTDALNPPHQYVPWVTLNGVHNEKIQNAAQNDLIGLICNTYDGPKPPACTKATPVHHSYIKN